MPSIQMSFPFFISFPLTLTIEASEVERKQKELDELKRQLEEEQAFHTSAVAKV